MTLDPNHENGMPSSFEKHCRNKLYIKKYCQTQPHLNSLLIEQKSSNLTDEK